METCKFCDIAQRKVEDYSIWENERFISFLDMNFANPGHCMLIPKEHTDYFFDLEDELYHELFHIARTLSVPLKKATNAKKIGIAVVGFDVPHAHLHLIPLHGSNELFDQTRFTKGSPKELEAMRSLLIRHIGEMNG